MKAGIIALSLSLFISLSINAQKVFVGSPFNEVGNELSMLIQDKLSMIEKKSEMKDGVMTIQYIPKIVTGKNRYLTLSYTVSSNGTISKIEATGTFKDVTDMFVRYWKTKADYNTSKNVIAERHFISDVIRLKGLPATQEAQLSVTGS